MAWPCCPRLCGDVDLSDYLNVMSRKLNDLCPKVRPTFFEFLARCVEQGVFVLIVDTLRTPEEQAANIARDVSWTLNSKHLPQTECGCGLSHAMDVAPYDVWQLHGPDKLQWNGGDPVWAKIIAIAEGLGLSSGKNFPKPDLGHFEAITTG